MTFVNTDVIAQGLSGFDPDRAAIRAGRIMLQQLHELAAERADFAFETTLAWRGYAGWLNSLREAGYRIHLFYFWLKSPELAVSRVQERVRRGGHDIPEATIRQRYARSVRNLVEMYIPAVTGWKVYDNSSQGRPFLVAKGKRDYPATILDPERWSLICGGVAND
jgi:predicted ABC-type ATPase